MPKIITVLYLLIGGIHIMARFTGFQDLDVYTKPLLMPLLIYLLYRVAEGHITLPRLLLGVSLLFSWIGDLLLMGEGELYFLTGLISFLLAQIIYSITFYKSTVHKPRLKFQYLVPMGIYGVVLTGIVLPQAGRLAPAIIAYALAILIMVFMASTRKGFTNRSSYVLVVSGAVLFILSDSLIALDRFYTPISYSGAWIMGTYIPAQVLITWGILKHRD